MWFALGPISLLVFHLLSFLPTHLVEEGQSLRADESFTPLLGPSTNKHTTKYTVLADEAGFSAK